MYRLLIVLNSIKKKLTFRFHNLGGQFYIFALGLRKCAIDVTHLQAAPVASRYGKNIKD